MVLKSAHDVVGERKGDPSRCEPIRSHPQSLHLCRPGFGQVSRVGLHGIPACLIKCCLITFIFFFFSSRDAFSKADVEMKTHTAASRVRRLLHDTAIDKRKLSIDFIRPKKRDSLSPPSQVCRLFWCSIIAFVLRFSLNGYLALHAYFIDNSRSQVALGSTCRTVE